MGILAEVDLRYGVPFALYPASESLSCSASADDRILHFLNNIHVQATANELELCAACRSLTGRLPINPDEGQVPGVPSGRLKNFGIKGEIVDVIEELRKLQVRAGKLIAALRR